MTESPKKEIKVLEMLQVRMVLAVLLLPVLLFVPSACNGVTVTANDVWRCSKLVPDNLWAPVEGAELPNPLLATDTDWQIFGNEQTNNLDDSNQDKSSIQSIITNCEDLLQEVGESYQRDWYEIWK